MRYESNLASDPDDGEAVVTYSRMMPNERRTRTRALSANDVAPFFRADSVPFVDGDDAPVIPEVRVASATRSYHDQHPVPDPLGEEKRPRLVRIVVFLGALAVVGGVGVLAVAYSQAINGPIGRAASATSAPVVAPANAPMQASALSDASAPAVRDVTLTPVPEPQPQSTATAMAPVSDAPTGPKTAPTPRPRPQVTAAAPQALTEGQPAPAASDMNALMDRIGQILATIPPEEDPLAPSTPPALPTLPGAVGVSSSGPSALAPLAPSGALSPVTVSGAPTATASTSANVPTPPAPIPDPAPLPVLR